MAILAITNGFDKLSDPNLETKAEQVLQGVSDNAAYFPKPKPAVAEMKVLIAKFHTALVDSKDGDRQKIAVKNQKRQELIDGLHLWGAYVLSQANGDPVVAMSSNFKLRKSPSPKPPIGKPENFRVAAGPNPLQIAGRVNTVPGAKSFILQYATDEMMATDSWKGEATTTTKCTLNGLTSGTVYNCRMVAIGPRNQIKYSDVLRCRVA